MSQRTYAYGDEMSASGRVGETRLPTARRLPWKQSHKRKKHAAIKAVRRRRGEHRWGTRASHTRTIAFCWTLGTLRGQHKGKQSFIVARLIEQRFARTSANIILHSIPWLSELTKPLFSFRQICNSWGGVHMKKASHYSPPPSIHTLPRYPLPAVLLTLPTEASAHSQIYYLCLLFIPFPMQIQCDKLFFFPYGGVSAY